MVALLVIVFIIAYILIATEHITHINKAAFALLGAAVMWTIVMMTGSGESYQHEVVESLKHHLSEISSILFFLLGAMTIVELIDSHEGFGFISSAVKTRSKVKLLWILCLITFFLSAVLDNLTTSIVMCALLKQLIKEKHDLWIFGSFIIIAANAGGAWSPIGDVTTIMLWVDGQVTSGAIISKLLLPSLISLLVPLALISFSIKGELSPLTVEKSNHEIHRRHSNLVLGVGLFALLFVPIFKTITHLPPVVGILFGLGLVWVAVEWIHRHDTAAGKDHLAVHSIIRRIDTPSILFFLGILLAVGALQAAGVLTTAATYLSEVFPSKVILNSIIGVLSSIVDNVPLVAAAMAMYGLDVYPVDDEFWVLLAYCAGTGGSLLIIGSAAGVAMMGILKIDFIWYIKKITLWAFIGYVAGIFAYLMLS